MFKAACNRSRKQPGESGSATYTSVTGWEGFWLLWRTSVRRISPSRAESLLKVGPASERDWRIAPPRLTVNSPHSAPRTRRAVASSGIPGFGTNPDEHALFRPASVANGRGVIATSFMPAAVANDLQAV